MVQKQGLVSKIIGILILVAVIVIVVIIKNKATEDVVEEKYPDAISIYGAIGGGKENLLADSDINDIFARNYGFKLVQDSWSNGKTVKIPVLREDGSMYDLIFFSDERYYNEYQTPAEINEAARYSVVDKQLTLNTPIVIYSWDSVVDVLIKEKIVSVKNDIYYITDMEKLMNYILNGKKWSELGLDIYGSVNIGSVDPVTSSPGATYYGLLLSIMAGGEINDKSFNEALPKLKQFYLKSGYMNNAPADLFSKFLKTGMGAQPMIVDYEKSVIDFANTNPDGWAQVKDKVRILYPTPTIWNSHGIIALSENGKKLIQGFNDKQVSQITWEKYGFRVGTTGGNYDVTNISKTISGIPQEITSVTSGLKIEYYEELVNYLKE